MRLRSIPKNGKRGDEEPGRGREEAAVCSRARRRPSPRRQAAACPTALPSTLVQELGMRKKLVLLVLLILLLLLLLLPTSWKGCQSLAGASPPNPTPTP